MYKIELYFFKIYTYILFLFCIYKRFRYLPKQLGTIFRSKINVVTK